MRVLSGCVLLLLLLLGGHGYEHGGPVIVCPDPVPWHEADPQTGASPVIVTVSSAAYAVNTALTVTLTGTRDFEGFMLGAKRVRGNTEELLGTWSTCTGIPARTLNWFAAGTSNANCVTHQEEKKTRSLTCLWKAPATNEGDIFFRAAVVVREQTLWLNVRSLVVSQPSSPSLSSSVLNSTSYTAVYSGLLDTSACGVSSGCIKYPGSCSGASCSALVMFRRVGETVDIRMRAAASGYISLGFSADAAMGDDETVTCAKNPDNNRVEVQRGVNKEYFNHRLRYTTLTQLGGKEDGGFITCRFVIPILTSATIGAKSVTFDRKQKNHIFLATGDLWKSTSAINKHRRMPLMAAEVDMSGTSVYSFSSTTLPVRLHAIVAVLAWLGLAVPIAQLPAHMRTNMGMEPAWRSWMRVHLVTLVISVVLSCASTVLMLVVRRGIAADATAHAAVGITTTVLAICQLVMGFIRPDPGAELRWLFNLLHLVNAILILIFTVVTMFLGFNMPLIHEEMTRVLNISFGVYIAVNFVFILCFRLRRLQVHNSLKATAAAATVTMRDMEISTTPAALPPSVPSRSQMVQHLPSWLFIIYVVIVEVITFTIIVFLILY